MRNNSNAERFDLKETQIAIKCLKDYFERELSYTLNLLRVSAPLFVEPKTGLNDNLSGVEKAVDFYMAQDNIHCEIVHSLAKWKRQALKRYGFSAYEGLYTDMNAIRTFEDLDWAHSVYVDQWDWEKIIMLEDRTQDFLKLCVRKIYQCLVRTETYINALYPHILSHKLPEDIYFVTTQEMEDTYPDLTPKQREYTFAKQHKAIFIIGIGENLKRSGTPHDLRAPDYDDWMLNGDIIVWNEVASSALELSSMGIRVDAKRMKTQLEQAGVWEEKHTLEFHRHILDNTLPQTIGGGIGQSRLCQFFLEKRHIGEVQCSVWDAGTRAQCEQEGIELL